MSVAHIGLFVIPLCNKNLKYKLLYASPLALWNFCMKLLPTTLELLSMPWLCEGLAAGLLVVWLQRRAYRYVLWQALGMLLLALTYALAPKCQRRGLCR